LISQFAVVLWQRETGFPRKPQIREEVRLRASQVFRVGMVEIGIRQLAAGQPMKCLLGGKAMRRLGLLINVALIAVFLASCATPTPEVIEKVVKEVVTQVVKETVKETVIVEGTPQVIEKEVTKVVEKEVTTIVEVEKVVTPTPIPEPTGPKVLTIAYATSDLDPLDIFFTSGFIQQTIVGGSILDYLVILRTDGTVGPRLITEWETNEDSSVWTVKLQKGVTCHNGEDWDAEDFIYSVLRARDHPKSMRYGYTRGMGELTALDSHTVQITTPGGEPHPMMMVDLGWFWAVCKDYTEPLGEDGMVDGPIIGTGPYKFVEYAKGEYLRAERNDDYWGGPPAYDEFVARFIPSSAVRVAALLAGEVDVVDAISFDEAKIIEGAVGFHTEQGPTQLNAWIQLDASHELTPDCEPNPVYDIRVREAMYHAIDLDSIIEYTLQSFAESRSQWQAPSVRGWDPTIERLPYDPERAKELLAEAGYPDGFDFVLDTYNVPQLVTTAEAIAAMWTEVGIRTTTNIPANQRQYGLDGHSRAMLRWSGTGSLDMGGFWSGWTCGGRVDWMAGGCPELTTSCFPEIIEMEQEAAKIGNLEERETALQAVQRYSESIHWVLPLYGVFKINALRDGIEWDSYDTLGMEARAYGFSPKK
jgi:peptide/nickel transport system substrate-binding protein